MVAVLRASPHTDWRILGGGGATRGVVTRVAARGVVTRVSLKTLKTDA